MAHGQVRIARLGAMERQQDYVLRTVEERGVRLIRLWFTDVLGSLKSFAISPAELENALEDGHDLRRLVDRRLRPRAGERRAGHARPEHASRCCRGATRKAPEARVFCDIHNLDGTPFEGDPRQVLRRNLDGPTSAASRSSSPPTSSSSTSRPPEKGQPPVPLDEGGFFDLTTTDVAGTLRKQTIRTLETMSIPVEYSFHEDAPSQHEIDLRHTDALTMADSIMTFRLVVKEVAARQGVHATFMPKPLEGVQGTGMHIHLSLFDGDENAFYDADDAYNLSPVAKQFMAGLLHHAAEITAITNQTVNSYKRLVPGLRGAGARQLGPQQPQRPRAGADRQARQRRRDPHRVPLARPGVQPVPGLLRSCWPPACAASTEGYELPAEADGQPVRDERRGAAPSWASTCCRSRSRRAAGDGAVRRSCTRRSASTSSSGSCATSAASGGPTRRTSRLRARPLPADAVVQAAHGTARRLPGPAAARAGPHARPRRLPVEGGRPRRRRAAAHEPADGWAGAIVACDSDPGGAWAFCRGAAQARRARSTPLLLLVSGAQLGRPRAARRPLRRLLPRPRSTPSRSRPGCATCSGRGRRAPGPRSSSTAALALNLETYQASIAGRPLDLTYMEYELLKFLAQHPGKVFTREILLSRVWGYEYYGGARTVDVHIRRLRAKLGEEHANLIQTVRSRRLPLRPEPLGRVAGSHLKLRVVLRYHG